jgi:hypothetical protein
MAEILFIIHDQDRFLRHGNRLFEEIHDGFLLSRGR